MSQWACENLCCYRKNAIATWSFGLCLHFPSSSSKKSPLLAYFCDPEKRNFDIRESLIFPLMNRVRDPHTSIRTSTQWPTTCSIYTQCNLCMQTVQSEIILNTFILSNKIKLLSKPGGTKGFRRLQLIIKEHLDGYLNTNSLQQFAPREDWSSAHLCWKENGTTATPRQSVFWRYDAPRRYSCLNIMLPVYKIKVTSYLRSNLRHICGNICGPLSNCCWGRRCFH